MTDRGEREVRKWALRRDGDPLEPHDVVELVFALDEDHADDMNEIRALVAQVSTDFAELKGTVMLHHEWAEADLKPSVAALKDAVQSLEMEGPRHDAMHDDHMREHHPQKPRRKDDPQGSEFIGEREDVLPVLTAQQVGLFQLLAGWSLFKKLAYAALAAVVVALVGLLISYSGSYFASKSADQQIIQLEQTQTRPPSVSSEATP